MGNDFWLPVISDLAAGYFREVFANWPESEGASAAFQSLATETVMMAVAHRVAPALSEVLPDYDASDISDLDVDDPAELVSSAGSVLRQVWALMEGTAQETPEESALWWRALHRAHFEGERARRTPRVFPRYSVQRAQDPSRRDKGSDS